MFFYKYVFYNMTIASTNQENPVNHSTRQLLLDLNRQFYATVADDFDVTRLNVPMGMVRVLNYVRPLVKDGEMGRWGDGENNYPHLPISPSPH